MLEHPSPLTLFPSSHCSVPSFRLLPQIWVGGHTPQSVEHELQVSPLLQVPSPQ